MATVQIVPDGPQHKAKHGSDVYFTRDRIKLIPDTLLCGSVSRDVITTSIHYKLTIPARAHCSTLTSSRQGDSRDRMSAGTMPIGTLTGLVAPKVTIINMKVRIIRINIYYEKIKA